MTNVRGKDAAEPQDTGSERMTVALIALAVAGVIVTLLASSAAHLLG